MRETTGAVFDTLAQIHLIRGEHDDASRCLQKAREAYGDYGAQTSRWYHWSRAGARGARWRCGAATRPRRSRSPPRSPRAGRRAAAYAMQARADRRRSAAGLGRRSTRPRSGCDAVADRGPAGAMSGTWGEFLRLRGRLHAAAGAPRTEAYHDFGQSVSVFELLGEKYQAGLSYLELGRLAGVGRARRSRATRYLNDARTHLRVAGRGPDLAEARRRAGRHADRRHRRLRRRAG